MINKLKNWCRFILLEAHTFPSHWKRCALNIMIRLFPDDEVSAVLRAKILSLGGIKTARGSMVRIGVKLGGTKLKIGSFASVGACCNLDCNDAEIVIGDYAVLSPRVTIVTGTHPLCGYPGRIGPTICKPVEIKDGAWVCTGAIILPGITIGVRSVVAAGSVVTRDVPDNTMVGGIPAKVIKYLD